jgi:hypothetical protein
MAELKKPRFYHACGRVFNGHTFKPAPRQLIDRQLIDRQLIDYLFVNQQLINQQLIDLVRLG